MRNLLLSSLLLAFGFAACADHSGSSSPSDRGPKPPVNAPDPRVIEPGCTTGETGGSGTGGGTSGENGNSGSGGTGSGSGGSGSEPGTGGGGTNSGPEGGGGSPVPEPGTLLLVGTGLAGLAGAAMRRRRKQAESAS